MNSGTTLVSLFILIHLHYTQSTHHYHRIFYNGMTGGSSPFDNFHHQIPLAFKFPRRPPAIDINNIVRFNLYTRQNPYTPQFLDTSRGNSELAATNYDADKATKILIHGFVDSASDSTAGEWMNDMRDAFLNTDDVNVIVMDYSVVALFLFYWTNLTQLSSGRLAELIYFLNKRGTSFDSFHLIGRSWGSGVAGMTGKTFSGRIGRITGLDPATNPPFKFVGFLYRLDKTDAQFVDVYHLNGKANRFLLLNVIGMVDQYDGLSPPTGTVDIYPNFQQRQQTGCPISNASLYTPSCQLGMGARLYLETIKNRDAFPVCPCESFLSYLRGECSCDSRSVMYMGNKMPSTTSGVYQLVERDNIIHVQVQGSTETIWMTPTPSPSSSTEDSTVSSSSTTTTTTTELETTQSTTTSSSTTDPVTQMMDKEVSTESISQARLAMVIPRTSKVASLP